MRGGNVDQIGVGLAIGIGLLTSLTYWRFASREMLLAHQQPGPVEIIEKDGKFYARYEATAVQEVEISADDVALAGSGKDGAADFLDRLQQRSVG